MDYAVLGTDPSLKMPPNPASCLTYVSNRNLLSASRNIGRHTSRFTVTTMSDMMMVASQQN